MRYSTGQTHRPGEGNRGGSKICGDQLYKGRSDHVVREPWLQQAPPATGGRRISKNMARKIRQKKQKERDRVEELERNKDGMGSDEGGKRRRGGWCRGI